MTTRQQYNRALLRLEEEIGRAEAAPQVTHGALRPLYRRRTALVAALRFPVWRVRVYKLLQTGGCGRQLACLTVSAPDQGKAVRNALIRYGRIYGGDTMRLTATASRAGMKCKRRISSSNWRDPWTRQQ